MPQAVAVQWRGHGLQLPRLPADLWPIGRCPAYQRGRAEKAVFVGAWHPARGLQQQGSLPKASSGRGGRPLVVGGRVRGQSSPQSALCCCSPSRPLPSSGKGSRRAASVAPCLRAPAALGSSAAATDYRRGRRSRAGQRLGAASLPGGRPSPRAPGGLPQEVSRRSVRMHALCAGPNRPPLGKLGRCSALSARTGLAGLCACP